MSVDPVKDKSWYERYRCSSLKSIVLPPHYKAKFNKCVETGFIPNYLFQSYSPGTGKTSTAKALANDCKYDFLYIAIGIDNGISVVRDQIIPFATCRTFDNRRKLIIMDEFERATPDFQEALAVPMEQFQNVTSFIAICNSSFKMIDKLVSRFQHVDFSFNDESVKERHSQQLYKRVFNILNKENVKFDEPSLKGIVDQCYPDMRKMLNTLQNYYNGFGLIDENILKAVNINEKLFDHILDKNWKGVRDIIINNGYNYSDLYRILFDKLVPKLKNNVKKDAIIIISDYEYRSKFKVDQEIQFAGCLMKMFDLY